MRSEEYEPYKPSETLMEDLAPLVKCLTISVAEFFLGNSNSLRYLYL